MSRRVPISSRNRLLYGLSVTIRRIQRKVQLSLQRRNWADERLGRTLPVTVAAHESLLLRKLKGTDPVLQRNKVASLELASEAISGVVVKPGETFSFWRLVGKPSRRRGFPPGLQLSFGRMVSMEGGGLCQMTNMLHWLALHTPLKVIERHRHDSDPFPDYRRTVPFGTGATVFYNYLDLMLENPEDQPFQIIVRVGEEYLHGEIRSSRSLSLDYSVEETDHRYVRRGDIVFRENRLWQLLKDAENGKVISRNIIMDNCARVCYDTSNLEVEEEG